jgi:hypothetical protein
MVSVAFQQPIGQLQHVGHPLVGEAVMHHPMFASGLHEPAPAEAGKVVGDLGLGQAEPTGQLPGRQLPLSASRVVCPVPHPTSRTRSCRSMP